MRRAAVALALLGLEVAGAAPAHDAAHDGKDHGALPAAVAAALPGAAQGDLPFRLGGAFRLTDQHGAPRSEADPEGRFQLLFFGYANCPSICSVALPTMAAAVDLLAAQGIAAVPVMITVDPARDTPETMGPPLAAIHPGFVGLTGDAAALAAVQRLFQVESKVVFTDPEHGAVFAHGSHVYLLDGAGKVLTLMPPILTPERTAEIVASYAGS